MSKHPTEAAICTQILLVVTIFSEGIFKNIKYLQRLHEFLSFLFIASITTMWYTYVSPNKCTFNIIHGCYIVLGQW